MLKSPLFAGTYNKKFPVQFPVIGSPKLDGLRCLIIDEQPWLRSLKDQVPNDHIRAAMTGIPAFDGEVIIGDPVGEQSCALSSSAINSKSKPELEDKWKYYIFDYIDPFALDIPYASRLIMATQAAQQWVKEHPEYAGRFVIVEGSTLHNAEELWDYETKCVEMGYEGIMIRDPNAPYKEGRSTAKQGILVKIKRWEDGEGIIKEVHEEMENLNEKKTNALGKAERSSHKENKIGKSKVGSYTIETKRDADCYFGLDKEGETVEFNLAATANMKEEELYALWAIRNSLPGRKVTFKYQYTTGQEKPRFPSFKLFPVDR